MLVAMKAGQLVLADNAHDKTGYSCPGCHEPVILRRGRHKIAHFAHRPGSQCQLGEGETAEHLLGKRQLLQWYRQRGEQVELEVYLPQIAQRPDLLLIERGHRVAIEFQCSPLSLKRLRERNAGYRQCGIGFHWLLGAPYQRRHLQGPKIAQFTQEVAGQPGLLFWDTRVGRLVVRRDLVRCSFTHGTGMRPVSVVKVQTGHLDSLQYGRGGIAARQLLAKLPSRRPLAACPLVCHDTVPTWPLLDEPVIIWRIRVVMGLTRLPIFYFWSQARWQGWLMATVAGHWLGFACLDPHELRSGLLGNFTRDLLREQILIACPGGYVLFRHPHWFASVAEKLNLLVRGGLLSVGGLE